MYHGEKGMTRISIRQLAKHASACIRDIEEGAVPVVIKRHEQPVAYIIPVEAAAELGLHPKETDKKPMRAWRPPS